jgi:hypothetical protein
MEHSEFAQAWKTRKLEVDIFFTLLILALYVFSPLICIAEEKQEELNLNKIREGMKSSLSLLFFYETLKKYGDICTKIYPQLESEIKDGMKFYWKNHYSIYTTAYVEASIISVLHGLKKEEQVKNIINNIIPSKAEEVIKAYLSEFTETKRKQKCSGLRSELLLGVHDMEKRVPEDFKVIKAYLLDTQIREAQDHLKNKGLYSNAIDGIIGPETIKALKVYQESIGIPVTGKLDETTKKAMEIH